uniref:Uncharacterized protein n=1 Tax=Glossina morsitans morsitans TaxID=37546 RepID=A0A1B0GEZ0_GLOMM
AEFCCGSGICGRFVLTAIVTCAVDIVYVDAVDGLVAAVTPLFETIVTRDLLGCKVEAINYVLYAAWWWPAAPTVASYLTMLRPFGPFGLLPGVGLLIFGWGVMVTCTRSGTIMEAWSLASLPSPALRWRCQLSSSMIDRAANARTSVACSSD